MGKRHDINGYQVLDSLNIWAVIRNETWLMDFGVLPSSEGGLIAGIDDRSLTFVLDKKEPGGVWKEINNCKLPNRLKCRVPKNSMVRAKVHDNNSDCHYYFNGWKTGGFPFNGSNEGNHPLEFRLTQDTTLNAKVLPHLKVGVHKLERINYWLTKCKPDSRTEIMLINSHDNEVDSAELGNHGNGPGNAIVSKLFQKKLSELGTNKYKVKLKFVPPSDWNGRPISKLKWTCKKDGGGSLKLKHIRRVMTG